MKLLRQHKAHQAKQHLKAGQLWGKPCLVFTDELGHHLATHTVYKDFKKIAASIGCPELRFHDLRHSYAVASIRTGEDIKVLQENLGHATAAFTLELFPIKLAEAAPPWERIFEKRSTHTAKQTLLPNFKSRSKTQRRRDIGRNC